jgi:hypothetical protein
MKRVKLFEQFISEAVDKQAAMELIDSLPKGSMFDDAKKIDGVFDRSKHTWSEVIEAFEKNQSDAKVKSVNVKDVKITQPNIQSNKIKGMLDKVDKLPLINMVQFPDGLVIYDGHHRLLTAWALGETKIKVNLVKI